MKNYKTTLLGAVLAVWVAVQPLFTAEGFEIKKDWPNLVGASLVALLGFFAKDFNVTGNPHKSIEPASKAE